MTKQIIVLVVCSVALIPLAEYVGREDIIGSMLIAWLAIYLGGAAVAMTVRELRKDAK